MTDTAGRERLREAPYPPTICKCGGAKDYHRPKDNRDHDYEPRYDPQSWREGYRAAVDRLRAALSGSSDSDVVLVRKNSGGVFPDGTTNHAIAFGASGSSDPEAVGLPSEDDRPCSCLHDGPCRASECGHDQWQDVSSSSEPTR
jgi:hypothetical protein